MRRLPPGVTRREFEQGYRPPAAMRHRVLERDGYTCQVCGATSRLQVAHIIPFPAGVTDEANLQVQCISCNLRGRRRWADTSPETLERRRSQWKAYCRAYQWAWRRRKGLVPA